MLNLINDFRKIPVLRVLFPFLTGIFLYHFTGGSLTSTASVLSAVVLIVLLVSVFFLSPARNTVIFTFTVWIACAWSGYMLSKVTAPVNPLNFVQEEAVLFGTVRSGIVDKGYEKRLEFNVKSVYVGDSLYMISQMVLLKFSEEDSLSSFSPGDQCIFTGSLKLIRNRGNTGEFDYKSFMARRNCFYTCQVDRYYNIIESFHGKSEKGLPESDLSNSEYLFRISDSFQRSFINRFKYFPARLRAIVSSRWEASSESVAILNALTMGDKSGLDQETKTAFSGAGAMHLLAISGLHVGIIWWILDQLLRFPRHKRDWNRLKMILILFVLWSFAAVAGFSQSVVRAVSMFSLVSLGRTVLRHSNVYQTLLLSAFVLLAMNPWRILEAGFQLSYMAVFGIVSIHPIISHGIAPQNKILKWIADLLIVSFAAQLATMPLSLHYFHSFPTYFFITNLVAIPLVSIILGSFMVLLPFLILFPQFDLAADIPLFFTHLLNHAVTFISGLPGSTIEMIPMPGQIMVLLIIALFCLILHFYYRKTFFIIASILIYTVAIALKPVSSSLDHNAREIELANFNRSTVLTALKGNQRETVVISEVPGNDKYVQKYIKTLTHNPFYLINHHLQLLAVNDSVAKGNVASLTHQLWSVKLNGNDILIIGKCNKRKLETVLKHHKWDILICRSGASLRPQMADLINESAILAGDATLWDYECRNLATWFPGMYLISEKGALKINTVKKSINP